MSLSARLWLGVSTLALGAGGGALWLIVVSDHDDHKLRTLGFGLFVGWSFVASGIVAWSRRPENAIGKLLVAAGFTFFVSALAESNHSIPFTAGIVLGAIPLAVLVHVLVAYPTGELRTRLERVVVGAAYAAAAILPALTDLFDKDPARCAKCPANALLIEHRPAVRDLINSGVSAVVFVLFASAIVAIVLRWRGASPASRRSMRAVFLAGGLTMGLFAVQFAVEPFSHDAAEAVNVGAFFGFMSVPVFLLLGVLHSRLVGGGLGRLVAELGRGTEPGALRDALAEALHDPTLEVAYWLPEREEYVDREARPVELVEGPERTTTLVERNGRRIAALIHDRAVLEQPHLSEAVVATAGLALENERLQAELRAQLSELDALAKEQAALRRVATLVATGPTEQQLLEAVTREVALLFEAQTANMVRYEAGQRLTVMGGWSEPGSRSVPPGSMLPLDGPTATHEVLRTGRPARIDSFEGIPGELAQMLRETGLRAAIAAPISVGGRLWGAVTVSKTNDERFPPGAEDRLGNFTALVAQAIANAEARDQLASSRARIVEAADDARRRLERNLHDGAQQRLVSLSISLRLAQSKLVADPAAAGEILGGASAELAQALEELRELARGIHPAILTDRGLRPALEALAARVPLPVEIEHDLDARLPAPVEAAAYYVVSESLANVAKYAQASHVLVRVGREDGRACIEVVDDGIGGADPVRGSGLRGLVDRVEALDGHLEVASAAGSGTRVRAEIPVRP